MNGFTKQKKGPHGPFFILHFLLLLLISCASAPEKSEPVSTEATPPAKEGALDEVMKNKDCGLLDVFYDGCKTIYSDAEKNLYKNNAENP